MEGAIVLLKSWEPSRHGATLFVSAEGMNCAYSSAFR